MAVKQVFLGPGNCFLRKLAVRLGRQRTAAAQTPQRHVFVRSQLALPQRLQPGQANISDFTRPFFVGNMLADCGDVAVGFLGLALQQFARFLVNFLMPLRKLFDEFSRHPLNLKIAPGLVHNGVAESPQLADQLVVIDVLNELLSDEHVVILQGLPLTFHGIECRVEQNAMAV